MRLKSIALMLLALPAVVACTAKARLDLSGHEGDLAQGADRSQSSDPAGAYPNEQPVARREMPPVDGQPADRRTMGWNAQQSSSSQLSSNKVIVVREGDTLYSIARQHEVTISQLFAVNGLVSDQLRPGQHIVIPRQN